MSPSFRIAIIIDGLERIYEVEVHASPVFELKEEQKH